MGRRKPRRSSSSSSSSRSDDDDTASTSSSSSSTSSSSMSGSSSSSSSSSSSCPPSDGDANGVFHGPSRPHSHHREHQHKSESRRIRSLNSGSSKRLKKRHSKGDHSSSSRRDRLQRKKDGHYIKVTSTKSSRTKRRTEKELVDEDNTSYQKRKKSRKFVDNAGDSNPSHTNNNPLQIALTVQEQQKAMIRHNAEIAKARLASGELQRAKEEQAKMLELYGAVDWRAKKKLRTEKKKLEQTVAAGKKLASLEERENARMDAFRVALGLPTAEAQRQAEWRAEATQALLDLENSSKVSMQKRPKSMKPGIIGPALPP